MAYKFFRVAWPDPAAAKSELNGFLRSHRAMKVRQQLVEAGEDSFWSFCDRVLEFSKAIWASGKAGPAT